MNGSWFLNITSMRNHQGQRVIEINELLQWIAVKFPGAYGLLYERDDEPGLPGGIPNFTVRVLARGQIVIREDPFLSPNQPTIED